MQPLFPWEWISSLATPRLRRRCIWLKDAFHLKATNEKFVGGMGVSSPEPDQTAQSSHLCSAEPVTASLLLLRVEKYYSTLFFSLELQRLFELL